MTPDELARFNKANQTVHTVETQWHYPIVTKYGYEAVTKTGVGFVRSYVYEHPVTKHRITCTTGGHGDYWESDDFGFGYWRGLEPYLKISNPIK